MNSKGILKIEEVISDVCENDRREPTRWWEGMSKEEIELEMTRIRNESIEEHKPFMTACMRIEIFTIVKTYIDLQIDDSDVVDYVSKRFDLSEKDAKLEVLIAKELVCPYYIR